MSDPIPALAARRDRIVELIADLGDMRPGSLSSRSRPCGKPDCQCRSPGGKPHGPYWSITFKLNGKTRNRSLRPDQVHTARQQIASFRRYQALSAELVEVSEQLCQARLAQRNAAAEQAKKKGLYTILTKATDLHFIAIGYGRLVFRPVRWM